MDRRDVRDLYPCHVISIERVHSMNRVMVRYKVKPELVARNEQLVGAVYEQLHERRPGGLRYATFALDDGVSFMHLASIERDGANPLVELPAFTRFLEGIGERCDEPPVVTQLREVGSFRLFDTLPSTTTGASDA